MFAKSKRAFVIALTTALLAISLVGASAGVAYAGPVTSPSGCGGCSG